jgi:hypothetical protein
MPSDEVEIAVMAKGLPAEATVDTGDPLESSLIANARVGDLLHLLECATK